MRIKPTAENPILVYQASHIWGKCYRVTWTNLLNYPRTITEVYRRAAGGWFTGEDCPTGIYNGGLTREANPVVASALDAEYKRANSELLN